MGLGNQVVVRHANADVTSESRRQKQDKNKLTRKAMRRQMNLRTWKHVPKKRAEQNGWLVKSNVESKKNHVCNTFPRTWR